MFYNKYRYGELSILALMFLIARDTFYGSFTAIVLQSTSSTLFHHVLFAIITELCFPQRFWINYLVILSIIIFYTAKQIHNLPIYYHPHTAKTEIWSVIGGRLIVVREITNQIQIAWLQNIFRNSLVQPTSVRDFPRPEFGNFGIDIDNLITRKTMVGLGLLSARHYYYRKGLLCYDLLF